LQQAKKGYKTIASNLKIFYFAQKVFEWSVSKFFVVTLADFILTEILPLLETVEKVKTERLLHAERSRSMSVNQQVRAFDSAQAEVVK
jgi:hypothetical protein